MGAGASMPQNKEQALALGYSTFDYDAMYQWEWKLGPTDAIFNAVLIGPVGKTLKAFHLSNF